MDTDPRLPSTKEQKVNISGPRSLSELNDQLRRTGLGGMVLVTNGVAALPVALGRQVIAAVEQFETFDATNDPYGEHDCGALSIESTAILWKIDYYDRARRYLSPDPADPKVTIRVLTIMLASEY